MSGERWRRFYADRDYDRLAYLAGERMETYVERFLASAFADEPDSFCSVGCGPAVTEFALARRHPDVEFHCYDVAEAVIADDRALAENEGITNVAFEVGSLPDLELGREFDVVYCVATLYFVDDIERALGTLYDGVAPGGALVVTYPNERTREWLADQSDRKREFFAPVADGRNLLTAGDVERVLGTSVSDFWAAVDADEVDGDAHPTVYARR